MSSISNVSVQTLDPRQILQGVERALPVEEKGEVITWANWYAEKLNSELVRIPGSFLKRIRDGVVSVWIAKNEEVIDLFFISRVSLVVGKGTFKKVKDLVGLRIFKEAFKESPVPITSFVVYRVQQNYIDEVNQGLSMQKKIIEGCGKKYFVTYPVVLGEYIAKNGTRKMEMMAPRYMGDMHRAVFRSLEPLNSLDKVELCLSVAEGVCLLGKLTPPIVHRDLKLDNILLKSEGEIGVRALISDFDKAIHPVSKDISEPKFHRHISFLTSYGQISVESDAYSLAILLGNALLVGFPSFHLLNFREVNVADRLQCQLGLGFFSLQNFKKKVSSECAKKVEEIFLRENSLKELFVYAKTLRDEPEASLVKEFAFELVVFRPIFNLLLKALREEQKAKESVLEQKKSPQEAGQEFHLPNAEEIAQVLKKCQAANLLFKEFLEGKIGEEAILTLKEAESDFSFQGQRLHANQLQDLMQNVLSDSGYDQILEASHLAENINAYLDFAKQEHFSFRFKKGSAWGAGHVLPFAGAFQKDELGISLYCIPRLDNTYACKDSHRNLKKVFSVRVLVGSSLEASSLVSNSLSIRMSLENVDVLNPLYVMHKNLMVFAKKHIVPFPAIDLMYQGKKGVKMEQHDAWSHGTLQSELSRLSVEQKIDVYLDVLEALQCLDQNKYVHRNIKPENISLRLLETGRVEARLSDFSNTTLPSLTKYKSSIYYYWNYASKKGYASIESDLYGLMKVIEKTFLITKFGSDNCNVLEHSRLSSIKEQISPLMQTQIQQLFDEKGGYGEAFSMELMILIKGKKQANVVEQFALESLLYPSFFTLFERMLKADKDLEEYDRRHRRGLSESEWQQALVMFPFPKIEEIRQVLEEGKASVKNFLESFNSQNKKTKIKKN